MKHLSKTAVAIGIVASMFAGCTHYTLPQDPAEENMGGMQSSMNEAAPVAQSQPVAMTKTVQQPMVAPSQPMRTSTECTADNGHYFNENGVKREAVKIRATGYGAPPKSFYPDPQRRLMAMRAAKIDAYRSLAERIYGVQIWGGTTLGDMVVEKDRFRVYIDTHLSGARVIAENPIEDGSYETIVEVRVDQDLLSLALPQKPKATVPCPENTMQPNQADGVKNQPINHAALQRTPRTIDPERDSATSNFYYTSDQ